VDLVTVVIPTYNRAEYVTDALDSVWAQSYRPLEVIVVDDGSTDDTETVVDKWITAHQDDGFKATYRYQENAGAPAARNHGLHETTGDWVKFLDSDDILYPESIERQVGASQSLGDREIVFGDLGRMDADGMNRYLDEIEPPRAEESSFEYLLNHILVTPTPLHRRSLLQEVEGFREDVEKGQEYDLHLRLALAGVEFVYEPGVVVYKRAGIEEGSITAANSVERNPEAHLFIQDNRCELAEDYYDSDIPDQVRRTLATGYWGTGRQMARAGYDERARYCFQRSDEYAVDFSHVIGPLPYRWLVRAVDPVQAEWILSYAKRLIGR
jgi:glycosyltransferase involved in cell wall biosynthesis